MDDRNTLKGDSHDRNEQAVFKQLPKWLCCQALTKAVVWNEVGKEKGLLAISGIDLKAETIKR